jgi:nucleoside-diphosphate-sugar epimerase
VLVTGAAGFLGRAVVERLLARGDAVRCLVRPTHDHQPLLTIASAFPGATIEFVEGDLSSVEQAREVVHEVSCVYHLAARMTGSIEEMSRDTVAASAHLADALASSSTVTRIVLVSSFSVYATAEVSRHAVVDESAPLETHLERRDPYAQTKAMQERVFWRSRENGGLPLVVVRPAVIYGPGSNPLFARLGFWHGDRFIAAGGGSPVPLTYVENCADAVIAVGDAGRVGEAYNVVDDDLPSHRALLRRYRREVKPIPSIPVPYLILSALGRRNGFPSSYRVATWWKGHTYSNARLKALGWRPRIATEEGLRRLYKAWASKAKIVP